MPSGCEPISLTNAPRVPSPALLLVRERWEQNIRQMLATVGGNPSRLRPHMKTHKLPQILHFLVQQGVTQVKCATVAEAELAALCGMTDVLLAMQPVGPNIYRLATLVERFPQVEFAALCDCLTAAEDLAEAAAEEQVQLRLWIDLDLGSHRTGIRPGPSVLSLAHALQAAPGLQLVGLHGYDGHANEPDIHARHATADAAYADLKAMETLLEQAGVPIGQLIISGSPSFERHAHRTDPKLQLSPGTTVLWDAGYAKKYPEMPYQCAAWLLTRIVSKPHPDLLCLDLGHKAVASEMPHPRAYFPALPDAEPILHSEEHLVLRTAQAKEYQVGESLLAVPRHVCPTVALHSEAWPVEHGQATLPVPVVARARRLSI
jgi:D-serine deaminase-like pyridoxal phosphate-dependent protein